MFRFSLYSLRLICSDCMRNASQKKAQIVKLNTSNSVINRLLHTSVKDLKKKGQYNDMSKTTDAATTNKPKVKLYPGFQESVEELKSQSNDEITAKKVIEDFYGLNELEFEDANDNEIDANPKVIENENVNFDVDYVVDTLRKESVHDICCIQIPKEINYADYMVIGTCLSDKHLNSVFQIMNRKYKMLKNEDSNFLLRKTGKESKWSALDTGKIVIHLFLEDYRLFYDLETLWACGTQFDEKYIEFTKERADIEKRLLVTEEEN